MKILLMDLDKVIDHLTGDGVLSNGSKHSTSPNQVLLIFMLGTSRWYLGNPDYAWGM